MPLLLPFRHADSAKLHARLRCTGRSPFDRASQAYHAWDPQHIEVRLHGAAAVLRCRSSMAVTFGPHRIPRADDWHTDLYEQRDGAWQVVWSQATGV